MITCIDVGWINLLLSLDFIPTLIPLVSRENANLIWNNLELDGLVLSGGNTLSVATKDKSEKTFIQSEIFLKNSF